MEVEDFGLVERPSRLDKIILWVSPFCVPNAQPLRQCFDIASQSAVSDHAIGLHDARRVGRINQSADRDDLIGSSAMILRQSTRYYTRRLRFRWDQFIGFSLLQSTKNTSFSVSQNAIKREKTNVVLSAAGYLPKATVFNGDIDKVWMLFASPFDIVKQGLFESLQPTTWRMKLGYDCLKRFSYRLHLSW